MKLKKMKILNSNNRNFDRQLNKLLDIRKEKVSSNVSQVSNIIKDVKKNKDKAVLKYEKIFNNNFSFIFYMWRISR